MRPGNFKHTAEQPPTIIMSDRRQFLDHPMTMGWAPHKTPRTPRTNVDMSMMEAPKSHHLGQPQPRAAVSQYKQLLYRYPPFFITFVSLFELFAFAYYAMRSDEPISLVGPVPYKSALIYNPYRRYEVWRFFTYALIHSGYWHLGFNILVQLAIGVPLETVHQTTPIAWIYMGGVLAGSLFSSILDPHTFLAGASSGCYALIAAHLANLVLNWNELKGACVKLISLLCFCITDLLTAVYERHLQCTRSIAYRTSYSGHLAGFVGGLLLGFVFLRNVQVHPWESSLGRLCGALYLLLATLAVAFNLLNPTHFPLFDTQGLDWSQNPFVQDRE